jgi:RHS repeat-associated protein
VRDVQNVATGKTVASYDYNAYGVPLEASPAIAVDHRYAGMFYLQEAGLYLTHYRVYNPANGKWLNRDPIAERGGINLYGYVASNPIDKVDSKGLFSDPLGFNITPSEAESLYYIQLQDWALEEQRQYLINLVRNANKVRIGLGDYLNNAASTAAIAGEIFAVVTLAPEVAIGAACVGAAASVLKPEDIPFNLAWDKIAIKYRFERFRESVKWVVENILIAKDLK